MHAHQRCLMGDAATRGGPGSGASGGAGSCLPNSALPAGARRRAVGRRPRNANYLNGGKWTIIAEFTETESGKRSDRPTLDKALAAARVHRCPVVVANVSRLTRSVAFLSRLLEAGVTFVSRTCRQSEADRPVHAATDGKRRRVRGRTDFQPHQGNAARGQGSAARS
jgi:Resolvase, N terminal domain